MSDSPVIAIVANRYSDFRRPVIEHVSKLLADSGYGLLCITGRELQANICSATSTLTTCNGIYQAASNFDVKGFLVISVTLGYETLPEQIHQLIERYRHKPVVSFGLRVPDIPSISIDNQRGMRKLMQHMTADPSRQRFVFIRGYPNMPDSIEREAIFRSEMSKKGLVVDEDLVITGNFLTADSFKAIDALLERTTDFDAIVAASDIMAISAIQALNKHGMQVPDDVIVSGFDDRPAASDSIPPLTTVRYSFEENATIALRSLLKQIKENDASAIEMDLPCVDEQLIVRESSQPSTSVTQTADAGRSVSHNTSDTSDTSDTSELSLVLQKNLSTVRSPEGILLEKLVDCFIGMLFQGSNEHRQVIDAYLQKIYKTPEDQRWWRHASYQLERTLRTYELPVPDANVQNSLAALLIRIQSTLWSVQEKQQFDTVKYLQLQDTLHMDLASCSSDTGVFSILEEVFRQLEVSRAYIVLYDNPDQLPDTQARLRFAFQRKKGETRNVSFNSHRILPESLNHELGSGLMVLSPLCHGPTNFGYLLIDPSNIKPLNIENLANSIGSTLCSCNRLSTLQTQAMELRSSNIELNYLAKYDPLTGLCNRNHFNRVLERRFQTCNATNERLGVLFLDLDGFKMVNDTLGHISGDELLKIVGQRLNSILGKQDTVARLGGDEFAIAVNAPAIDSVVALTLDSLSKPFSLGPHKINLTVSIGSATYPEDGISVDELLKHADTAMYHAKDAGKNRFSVYHSEMNEAAQIRILTDQAMRDGLPNNEFTMYYQPRVDTKSGTVVAFEALMRWLPVDSVLPANYTRPDVFIALAEKTGFITELDTFALHEACAQLCVWHNQGYPIRMSVNMSIAQLQQKSIVSTIDNCLKKYHIDPEYLELEITEYTAMLNVTESINTLTAIQQLGVHISIDDFGTGYSSLNYLKQLPVSCLKIDRSFLQGIDSKESFESADAAIIKAIMTLSKSMKYRVIVEGVETSVQRDFLEVIGCEESQGFLYSPPLERSIANRYLANSYNRMVKSA